MKVAVGGQHDSAELRVLDPSTEWAPHSILYESDHRHAERLFDEVGVKARQTVVTPAVRDSRNARKNEGEAMGADGDPPLSGVRQPCAGRRTTPRASVGQASAG